MKKFRKIKNVFAKKICKEFNPERRKFGKLALVGTLGVNTILSLAGKTEAAKINTSNVKLAGMGGREPSDEDLKFYKQIGLDHIVIWATQEQALDYKKLLKERKRIEDAGFKVINVGYGRLHNRSEITLNLPGREELIEEYKVFIRNVGKAGIPNAIYAHMANGIWSTERETTRGGASTRALDFKKLKNESRLNEPTHGRIYEEKEIWDNYKYFIKAVKPAIEESGVRVGIHPDDPPGLTLGGIPRCIFSSFEGYKHALEIADSDNIGICLCCGCWLEGGKRMGKDLIETIHYFGKQNKIVKVHFRNVKSPLPHFVEAFVDDGYMDMYKVMKALVEVNNYCSVIDDHIPQMVGGKRAQHAFSYGYMRALLERAVEESGM